MDVVSQLAPAIIRNQAIHNLLQCNAVHRIIGLLLIHKLGFVLFFGKLHLRITPKLTGV